MSKQSAKIIKHFKTIQYWKSGLLKANSCWVTDKAGIALNSEERTKMHEASRYFREAERIVTEIYSKRIGDAITRELYQ